MHLLFSLTSSSIAVIMEIGISWGARPLKQLVLPWQSQGLAPHLEGNLSFLPLPSYRRQ